MASRRDGAAAGLGIGLLLGLLIGLSASPVVAAVLGGLVGLLATFFGFAAVKEGAVSEATTAFRGAAVAAFGIAAAVALLVGLYLRANAVLSPSPADRMAKWEAAGFPAQSARTLTAFEITGLAPTGMSRVRETESPTSTLLFAGARAECDRLDPASLPNAESWRLAMGQAGGVWAEFGDAAAGAEDRVQMELYDIAWRLVCS